MLSPETIDRLTGLPTFHALPSALTEVTPAVFFDIDGFRRVNYELDHLVGDDVLVRLGGWLADEARSLRGQVFRVAGEEFILLLPGRSLVDATAIAKDIVSRCPSREWPTPITLSAVVFAADTDLPNRLRAALDVFATKLYEAELSTGRTHSNIVSD